MMRVPFVNCKMSFLEVMALETDHRPHICARNNSRNLILLFGPPASRWPQFISILGNLTLDMINTNLSDLSLIMLLLNRCLRFSNQLFKGYFPIPRTSKTSFSILLKTPFPNLNSFYVCDLINIEDIGTPLLSQKCPRGIFSQSSPSLPSPSSDD